MLNQYSDYITGDRHGERGVLALSHKNWKEGALLTRDNHLFIAGDFAVVYSNPPIKSELNCLDWLNKNPWTTLVVDGNHENFPLLNALPRKRYCGGEVGIIRENVLHLRRGEIYTINGSTYFIFGGAQSHDIQDRIERAYSKNPNYRKQIRPIEWWEDELPSKEEMKNGLRNLEKINYEVDYVITHTAPVSIIQKYASKLDIPYIVNDILVQYLETITNKLKFKTHYFGHFHKDIKLDDKYTCVYNKIIKIGYGK